MIDGTGTDTIHVEMRGSIDKALNILHYPVKYEIQFKMLIANCTKFPKIHTADINKHKLNQLFALWQAIVAQKVG